MQRRNALRAAAAALVALSWSAGAQEVFPARPLRIVLAGDAPPDDALHRAVEACCGSVVLELAGSVAGG
jgi:hypothetical protein